MAKFEIEINEVKEGGGCGQMIAWLIIGFIVLAAILLECLTPTAYVPPVDITPP